MNSPLYDSSNNGILTFDGVNDYFTIGVGTDYFPLPEFTIDLWYKSSGLGSGMNEGGLFCITYGLCLVITSVGNVLLYIDDGTSFTQVYTTGFNAFDDTWHNIVAYNTGSFSYIYIDGIYKTSGSSIWSGTSRWTSIYAYLGTDANNPPVTYFKGSISSIKLYNRILINDEITQNYRALKGRFI